jgi:hypothetical protein
MRIDLIISRIWPRVLEAFRSASTVKMDAAEYDYEKTYWVAFIAAHDSILGIIGIHPGW